MRRAWLLAWRAVAFHRLRTALLVFCLAVTLVLPAAVRLLIGQYEAAMRARAATTPLLVAAPGSRYDAVMRALYFRGGGDGPALPASALDAIEHDRRATAIPIHARFSAEGFPVVGTTPDYLTLRGLEAAHGTAPLRLGDAALGAEVARALGIGVGDTVDTDQQSLYDLGAIQPLRLRVVGVLAPEGGPDDRAIFTDVKTTWVIAGIGHGHQQVEGQGPGPARANPGLVEQRIITADNAASFHFHGDPGAWPLDAAIVVPRSQRDATILKARLASAEGLQPIAPPEVIEEVMGVVLKVRAALDANFLLVALTTSLLLVLVIWLSLQLRRQERLTLARLGASRRLIVMIQLGEWGLILLLASGLAALALGGLAALDAGHLLLASGWLG